MHFVLAVHRFLDTRPQNDSGTLTKFKFNMRNLIWLFLVLWTGNVYSQSPSLDFKYGLKISNMSGTMIETSLNRNASGIPAYSTRLRTMDLLQLVPAFTWQTKQGNFSEVSIPWWQVQKQESAPLSTGNGTLFGATRKVNLAVQYTHSIRFLKQKTTKWLPMLGFAAMPYFRHAFEGALVSTEFPASMSQGGLQAALKPHVMWIPNARFFMDFGLQLSAFDVSYRSENNGNPSLPLYERRTFSWEMASGQHGIQIGAGMKL
jgi:hypothetical protein